MRTLIVCIASSLIAACSTTRANYAKKVDDEVRSRASFDLDCPAASLQLTPLTDVDTAFGSTTGSSYGVRGCGHRAV